MFCYIVAKPDKVWIKRAKEMKAEVIVNVDAEQKAQSLQDQVLKLVKEAKLKVKHQSTLPMRCAETTESIKPSHVVTDVGPSTSGIRREDRVAWKAHGELQEAGGANLFP